MVKGINAISVTGFKSLAEGHPIEIRPLTILAGANSSGKSSIMQPLLMMKQTLHESYDPGDLKINGPNVRFTKINQFLSRCVGKNNEGSFKIQINVDDDLSLTEIFAKQENKRIKIVECIYTNKDKKIILHPDMTQEELLTNPTVKKEFEEDYELFSKKNPIELKMEIERNRCFLKLMLYGSRKTAKDEDVFHFSTSMFNLDAPFESYITQMIHVPALRGNPKRDYDISAIGPIFPGTFENYVASIIQDWQVTKNPCLEKLYEWLQMLNLTQTVSVEQIDDTRAEIRVGRLPAKTNPTPEDLVSIADVGFGVSQTLPVLVALLKAIPGQLVYIEQPEIHLHPRAQVALAKILAEIANNGIRIVVETHSALLLRGIQTIVAKGEIIPPEDVKLHWFERMPENGITKIESAELDEAGSFGDWPEDFGDAIIDAESDFIEAAESHLRM